MLAMAFLLFASSVSPGFAASDQIPGEVFLRTIEGPKFVEDGYPVTLIINLYGIPVKTEPQSFKNVPYSRYVNVMIDNPGGWAFSLATLIQWVDEAQFSDKKWRGFLVTRMVIEDP